MRNNGRIQYTLLVTVMSIYTLLVSSFPTDPRLLSLNLFVCISIIWFDLAALSNREYNKGLQMRGWMEITIRNRLPITKSWRDISCLQLEVTLMHASNNERIQRKNDATSFSLIHPC